MTDQQNYSIREIQMQHFRWATPAGLFILTSALIFFGWLGNDYLSQIRSAITDLKTDETSHYDKLWTAIGTIQTKETADYEYVLKYFAGKGG